MNFIEFYTDDERIIQEADKEFTVATVLSPSKGGEWDKTKIGLYDGRSEDKMQAELRRIYNRVEQTA